MTMHFSIIKIKVKIFYMALFCLHGTLLFIKYLVYFVITLSLFCFEYQITAQ